MKPHTLRHSMPLWGILILVLILTSCNEEMVGDHYAIRYAEIKGSVTNTAGRPVDNATLILMPISLRVDNSCIFVFDFFDFDRVNHMTTNTNAEGKYLKTVSYRPPMPQDPGREFLDSLWLICEPPVGSGLQKDSTVLVLNASFPRKVGEVEYKPVTVDFTLK